MAHPAETHFSAPAAPRVVLYPIAIVELALLNAFTGRFIQWIAGFPVVAPFHDVINAIFPFGTSRLRFEERRVFER